MFSLLGAFKTAVGTVADRFNGFAEFVVVPKIPSGRLLKEFGIDPNTVDCYFCHDALTDLRQIRAIYNYGGRYVAACDKFECTIKARDRLIE